MRRAAVALALLAAACAGPSNTPAPRAAAPAPTGVGTAARPAVPRAFTPAPDRPVPRDPHKLAEALATTTGDLRAAIETWTSTGHPSRGQAPMRVQLLALYQQRMYRFLARHPDTAKTAIAAVPGWLRGEAHANLRAGEKLFSLVHPVKHRPRFKVGLPKPANVLLGYDRAAQRRFHVSWTVLAAVNYIESKFGRVRSNSYAGAQGPMQFIPSTWAAYGMGGDVHDPHDAIMGAANYLHHSGAPRNYANALYSYNHSYAYVDAVLLYANQMRGDVRDYYEYYDWQVFIVTPYGDKRLTGPGL